MTVNLRHALSTQMLREAKLDLCYRALSRNARSRCVTLHDPRNFHKARNITLRNIICDAEILCRPSFNDGESDVK